MKSKEHTVPFFPLSVFLVPGEDLPLRIFEPRYLQLMEDAKDPDFTFVIPFVRDDRMTSYGCEVKLQQEVAKNIEGNMVVTVEALRLVKITSFVDPVEGKLYSGGTVEVLPDPPGIQSKKLLELVTHYSAHFNDHFLPSSCEKSVCFYDIIRGLNLSSADKYKFITMDCDRSRELFLMRQIEYLMLIRRQEKMLDDDYHLN